MWPGDGKEGLEAVTAVGLGGDRVMLKPAVAQFCSNGRYQHKPVMPLNLWVRPLPDQERT